MPNQETSLREILDTLQAEPKVTTSALPVICVLCKLVEKSVLTALAFFFSEFVNDPAIRVNIRRSRGFCREHTQSLLSCGDALGIAILYSDLLDHTLTQWKERPPKRSRFPLGRSMPHNPQAPCPACAVAQEATARYVNALAQGLEHSEVCRALEESPPLCVTHVERVLTQAKPQQGKFLLDLEKRRLEALYTELEETIRKNDYRFSHEEWGEEKDAWLRALIRLTRPE
ncbi:MAG: DUF6062 family protein [Armatimonadetes bacterium]|nr:DUF6062 family protein [Armatimonadota bacterium]